jgi:acyl dehydratase
MTTSRTDIRFEEIESLKDLRLQGEWFSVDPDRVEKFDEATYMTENTPSFGPGLYPDNLVEGFQLLALLDHLSNEILRADPSSITGWNYGLDRARFVTPVTTNDKIRLNIHIADVTAKDDAFVLTLDVTVDHSGSERPAFVARWLVYWLPVATSAP